MAKSVSVRKLETLQRLVAKGLNNKQISKRLRLSEKTVIKYKKQLRSAGSNVSSLDDGAEIGGAVSVNMSPRSVSPEVQRQQIIDSLRETANRLGPPSNASARYVATMRELFHNAEYKISTQAMQLSDARERVSELEGALNQALILLDGFNA